jgi:cell division transport system permease protein
VLLARPLAPRCCWLHARRSTPSRNHRHRHLLGGTDRQIARIFQRSTALDAAIGGLVGLLLGVAIVWLLGRSFAGLASGMATGATLGWLGWTALALIPLAAVVLATVTARAAVLGALRRML